MPAIQLRLEKVAENTTPRNDVSMEIQRNNTRNKSISSNLIKRSRGPTEIPAGH